MAARTARQRPALAVHARHRLVHFSEGLLAGLGYGFAAGTFRSDRDVMVDMKEATESLGVFLVLVFFALVVAFVQRYDPKAGIGTVIATMLPYSLVFMLAWMLLLVIWLVTGLPLGPGAGLYLAG
ncbi:MAG: AbgT family transporter [bacterium]